MKRSNQTRKEKQTDRKSENRDIDVKAKAQNVIKENRTKKYISQRRDKQKTAQKALIVQHNMIQMKNKKLLITKLRELMKNNVN